MKTRKNAGFFAPIAWGAYPSRTPTSAEYVHCEPGGDLVPLFDDRLELD